MFSVCFTNCSKDNISVDGNVTSITVKLKSTTNALDKVYIDIEDVQLKVIEDENNPNAWVSLNAINQGVFNACDFRENDPLVLVDNMEIEADYVFEIRLVLGDNNFMDISNTLHSLDVSYLGDAAPSNLIGTQLNPKRRYDVVIDIDIDASVSYNEQENIMVLSPKLYTEIRQIEY
ncbi:DUF4382 domain-containing protein [Winogradskyella sp.]|uniref:DUF4382 domain-containing protein n=1 Tax=Winogradskyella sp. TaxID=1883156 RepID=UPI00261C48A0|nr:DUF4382 domain-containing protein [Winogradskyella sp.]